GKPLTPEAEEAAAELPEGDPRDFLSVDSVVPGFVVLTQTCDLARESRQRPFAELAPLRKVSEDELRQVIRCERPTYAYIPVLADRRLVADLNGAITVEKAVLASITREPGMLTDADTDAFQKALARNRSRFAFPTPFNEAMIDFQRRIIRRAGRNSPEGRHVDALSEIRVTATPSWRDERATITLWLIKKEDPPEQDWTRWISEWENLIDQTRGYMLDGPPRVRFLEDMNAREYLESQHLDLDHLSL
ncbi:MAG: hypothetical protein ACREC6_08585, partial [Hyphomicrobiaceae bacterium]